MQTMKVKTIIGAQAAYICIQTATTSLDVKLNGGKSVSASLKESAQELKDQAAKLLARAALIEQADNLLPF